MLRLDDALHYLVPGASASGAPALASATAATPAGAPRSEFTRSRAAATVGAHGARAGLFLFHYEHRQPIDSASEDAEWVDGVLAEPKYGAFRHDLPIGSFHPMHRGKWGAHEVCHGLVGFGWKRGASPLFLATAARLCELAPVVLWYFLDEIGLVRCPLHEGPLFRTFCAACERAAASGPATLGPAPAKAERALRAAQAFVDDELGAIARTLRLGRPVSHVWGSIDLCSDGLAYAAGHRERLASPWFEAFADRFLSRPDTTWHETLEDLENRALTVIDAIRYGTPLDTVGTRERWVHWDLGQRLLEVWADCDGEAATALLGLADRLASDTAPETAAAVHADYVALAEAYELPEPEDLFAVGYPIDGVPTRAVERLAAGLQTIVPMVLLAAEDAEVDLVTPFVANDDPALRAPLGERFLRWLAEVHPGPLVTLGAYEVALRQARHDPMSQLGPSGEGWQLAEGATALVASFDVVTAAEQVESGLLPATTAPDGTLTLAVDDAPGGLVIGRDGAGELVLAEVPVQVAKALQAGEEPADAEVLQALAALGVVTRRRWTA